MRARPRARTAAIRSRRCWLERSDKDRFDVAYPTVASERELEISQLTRVMNADYEVLGLQVTVATV